MNHINPKKARLYNSRIIRTENDDNSFSDGKLTVPDFLEARKFEINAFEKSQLRSKYASATRCFQSLPRSLRRRAASHNVKRIPKRLRARALREMQKSELPTTRGLKSRERYKLKMTRKLLKLASKLKSSGELPIPGIYGNINLKERIKKLNDQLIKSKDEKDELQPNNKVGSYDIVGINERSLKPRGSLKYFKRQTDFVWLPTHIWHAKRFHMMRKWGYQIPYCPTQKCFKAISRSARYDSVAFDTSYFSTILVKFCSEEQRIKALQQLTKLKRKVPENVIKGMRSYDDWIYLNEICIGKGLVYSDSNTNQLLIRVHPSLFKDTFDFIESDKVLKEKVYDCRYAIGSIEISGPKALNSLSKILHLKEGNQFRNKWFTLSEIATDCLIPDGIALAFSVEDPRFFKHPTNVPLKKAQVCIPEFLHDIQDSGMVQEDSVKALLTSKGRTSSYKNQTSIKELGVLFQSHQRIKKESSIPIFVTRLKSRNSWCVMCPWYWVLPMWLKLYQVKGVTVAGTKQMHQINFESGLPSYPSDFPFFKEGFLENEFKSIVSYKLHGSKPKSKMIPYEKNENGLDPFSCDWDALRKIIIHTRLQQKKKLAENARFGTFDNLLQREINCVKDIEYLIKDNVTTESYPIQLYDKSNQNHQAFFSNSSSKTSDFSPLPVKQVKLRLLGKGTIQDNARIYRIDDDYQDEITQPRLTDLIGYITTGSFNLRIGVPSGIGCIFAAHNNKTVMVRNVNSSVARLAEYICI